MLKALESGSDGVAVVGCPEGDCQYLAGSARAGGRVRQARKILSEIGLGEDRIQRFVFAGGISSDSTGRLSEWLGQIRTMGPIHCSR